MFTYSYRRFILDVQGDVTPLESFQLSRIYAYSLHNGGKFADKLEDALATLDKHNIRRHFKRIEEVTCGRFFGNVKKVDVLWTRSEEQTKSQAVSKKRKIN